MSYLVDVSDGVRKEIVRLGAGMVPQPGSVITVHCTGYLANPLKKFWRYGSMFQRCGVEDLFFYPNNREGWDECCLTMQQGEIAKICIRSDKGYGRQGFPAWGIPPNADLLFEIEVLCIQ